METRASQEPMPSQAEIEKTGVGTWGGGTMYIYIYMSRFMVYRRCTWGFKDVQGVCINGPFRVLSLGLTQGFGLLRLGVRTLFWKLYMASGFGVCSSVDNSHAMKKERTTRIVVVICCSYFRCC